MLMDKLWLAVAGELQGQPQGGAISAGRAEAVVRAYLAERRTGGAGYDPEYVRSIRGAVTPAQTGHARRKLEDALSHLPDICTRVLLRGVKEWEFFAGATPENLSAFGAAVADFSDHWAEASWGTAGFLARYLQDALAVPGVTDEALLPVLAWLLWAVRQEWEWSRGWDETLLGCAGHNWRLHTWLGLFTAGALFPEFPSLCRFRSFAETFFERELFASSLADGFSRERSGYHWGVVEDWLRLWNLREQGHIRFSSAFEERFQAVLATVWKTATPDGGVPRWGDTGTCYVNGAVLDMLRVVAAVTGQGEAKYVAQCLDPDWQPPLPEFWPEFGRNLLPRYEAIMVRSPESDTADTVLPDSGYYILRSGWTRRDDAITIDAGAFGTVVSSHTHTHVFPLEFFVRGEPLLADNCNGSYGASPERLWRVGSAGHNVAMVDGQDHIPMKSEWRWEHPVIPEVNDWLSRPAYSFFQGAHEGYARLPEPVTAARRSVFWLRGDYAILIDRFTAPGEVEHTYDQHFHLLGGVRQEGEDRIIAKRSEAGLMLLALRSDAAPFALEACPYPLEGCDNPDHACRSRKAAGNFVMVTLLAPFVGNAPDVSVRQLAVFADGRELSSFEATGLEIEYAGRCDTYVQFHTDWVMPWKAGDCTGVQRLFHSTLPSGLV